MTNLLWIVCGVLVGTLVVIIYRARQATKKQQADIARLQMTIRDLSEHKRFEARLLQAQHMENIGQLAGSIAHDFNNLLTVIRSCADIALGSLTPDHPATVEMREIVHASEHAARLTRQLLAMARNHHGTLVPCDLNQLVQDLEPLLQRALDRDMRLSLQLSAEPLPIIADPGQIEQVLLNLALNARDAMPQRGTLTIATSMRRGCQHCAGVLADLPPGDYVLLDVRDTGTGIAPDVQKRLFEPFFTTKAPGKGTGLGLATCHGIVHQHGGRITCTSILGTGATFTIALPRAAHAGSQNGTYSEAQVRSQASPLTYRIEARSHLFPTA